MDIYDGYAISSGTGIKLFDGYCISGGQAVKILQSAITWTGHCSVNRDFTPGASGGSETYTSTFAEAIYINSIAPNQLPAGSSGDGKRFGSCTVTYSDDTTSGNLSSGGTINPNKAVKSVTVLFSWNSVNAGTEMTFSANVIVQSRDFGTFNLNNTGTSNQ